MHSSYPNARNVKDRTPGARFERRLPYLLRVTPVYRVSLGSEFQRIRRSTARRELRVVENTGIEPVTSWLQTRRSPS